MMRHVLAAVIYAELQIAMHIATAGEWWAARAARRYGKFSGKPSRMRGPWDQ